MTAAEKIAGSKKLLKLQVDLGGEARQIVSGIADAYAPEALVGRKVVLVANLKPAKLMGVESNGMVLAASVDGKAVLCTLRRRRPAGHEGQVTPRPRRATVRRLRSRCSLRSLALLGCPRRPQAGRLRPRGARCAVADRWSSREVLLFGTPAAEPHQAEGFYREAAAGEGDASSGRRARPSCRWLRRTPRPRPAVVDLAPYERRARAVGRGAA